ncbi:hyaluronidase-1 isoform X2 [Carettochelys insculpta]|uniref:hyaluronidase-1 isoform X2 n=1 Tax=Carettochelys insculpta TaxID=44489 RepID=UPI003EBBD42C
MAGAVVLLPWVCLLGLAPVAGGGPIFGDRPFIAVWNAPSQQCRTKYDVALDLGVFDVVLNHNQSFLGQEISLFYSNTLGLYPHYDAAGRPAHGGVPQNGSLPAHLHQARADIAAAIPEPGFRGLAVIDWESWRPVWARNWDALELNREKSEELVRGRHPDWPPAKVAEVAQGEFEQSARAYMEQTLALGRHLRPGGFWGFYGFPDCYNADFEGTSYTGECPAVEQQRNEQLRWLWDQSRALYPSIYLPKELRWTDKVGKFVRHRVGEAFRVQGRAGLGGLPVLPYARIQYELTEDFLSQESCLALKEYVDGMLGRYIVNVTSSAHLCSRAVCSSHGRCVRQAGHPEAFLHLGPAHTRPHLHGQLAKQERAKLAQEFSCRCYAGWAGARCEQQGKAE